MAKDYDVMGEGCPSRSSLARIASKWPALVILALREGPLRFTQVQAVVEGISNKVLTATLRTLERDGLVAREAFPGVPARVEYSLTPLGRSVLEPMAALRAWAEAHAGEVLEARAAYDARHGERAGQD
ncbi:winged helix-turn-helix transcriptional regulator [Actinomyces capricornis]|uniref:Transcriptional regulator n=1 Tax=Actinomyces capricornis TaxID=2755559 RepID=A0ABN6K586_9ACTO|nr:helix-turn-helix domain-containing protein [Actinomyces capricornis]BDA63536.1 transcriptional regulator [Actinomyces capricornis]